MCVLYFCTLIYPGWTTFPPSLTKIALLFTVMFYVIVISMAVLLVYNVYEYYTHLIPNCSCIDQIESMMMYVQALYYTAFLVMPIALLLAISVFYLKRD